jgi:4-hydroxy-2-oxoheptanedioate aldolase
MITPNRILERYRNGEKALGVSLSFVSEGVIEAAARMGMDFISLDGQHGALTLPVIESVCRICDGFGITPAMRVVDQSEAAILTALDRGMRMITVPNLQNAEEAERIVQFGFYGPLGRRSAMSLRVAHSINDARDSREVFKFTNENTLIVPQLESKTAFDNLDEILQVEGIHFFTGGSQDIAQSMGYPGEPNHPECVQAYQQACEQVRSAGKHMIGDVTVSVDAFGVIYEAGKALLEAHGRECGLHIP